MENQHEYTDLEVRLKMFSLYIQTDLTVTAPVAHVLSHSFNKRDIVWEQEAWVQCWVITVLSKL